VKILLVEDAHVVLEYEAQILRRAGHTVRATDNGDRAAEYYNERPYDLVLTDLWHPGLEGHNLIKRILKKNPKQAIGVISSTTEMEEKLDVPLMRKPFEPNDLLAFLSAIMSPRLPGDKRASGYQYGDTQYLIAALEKTKKIRKRPNAWG
jgi:DNA-binding response OmpR family regulator